MRSRPWVLALVLLAAVLSSVPRAGAHPDAVPDRSTNVRELAFVPSSGNLRDAAFWKDLVIASRAFSAQVQQAWYDTDTLTYPPLDQAIDCTKGYRLDVDGQGPLPEIKTEPANDPDRCGVHAPGGSGRGPSGIDIFRILPQAPFLQHVSSFDCRPLVDHGAISVWRQWVFMSVVEARLPASRCGSPDKDGIVVIDIGNPAAPEMDLFIPTSCAAGTHSLLPAGDRLYIYGGGHNQSLATCNSDSALPSGEIEVIRFQPGDPPTARVASRPRFEDATGCHDLTVLTERNLGICSDPRYTVALLDIRDPVNPVELGSVPDTSSLGAPPMASWDGEVVVDYEADNADGACISPDPANEHLLQFYRVTSGHLQEAGSLGLPRFGGAPCRFMTGNVIPMRGEQDVMVTAWARGGMSMIDFSDPSAPTEIAHWLLDPTRVQAAYWYNGRIYLVELGTYNERRVEISEKPPGIHVFHGGPQAVLAPSTSGIRVLDVAGFGEAETRYFRNGFSSRSQIADFVRDDPPRRAKGMCRRGKRAPDRRCRAKAASSAP